MVLVALGEAAAFVAVVSILARLLVSQQRAHNRREDLLLNQLLHATGHTWQEPPVAESRRNGSSDDLQRGQWTTSPEQFPLGG